MGWVDGQIERQLHRLRIEPIGFTELAGVYVEAPTVSLEREIAWVSARILRNVKSIKTFVDLQEIAEIHVFNGDFAQAVATLEAIHLVFGASFWGIQLRTCLEHSIGGLDQQKKYTAEVRSHQKTGLLNFIAYHTSVRNEDKTTLLKFKEDISTRIEKHEYWTNAIKSYVSTKLTGQLPKTELSLAAVLRTEQSHSLIDLHETFVSVLQELVKSGEPEKIDHVRKCIGDFVDFPDFRLRKLALAVGASNDVAPTAARNRNVSDLFFSSDIRKARRSAIKAFTSTNYPDTWDIAYAGLSFAGCKAQPQFRSSKDVCRLLGASQGTGAKTDDALAYLLKLATNLRGLPTFAGGFTTDYVL